MIISRVLGGADDPAGARLHGALGRRLASQREFRIHSRPAVGLAGAPMLGVLFGIGWTPCIGPTLAAVQTLAFERGERRRGRAADGGVLPGLGVPFVVAAIAFRRTLGAFGWVKQHYAWVMRIGGGMLVAVGVLLVTGVWDRIVYELQVWSSDYTVGI